VSSAVNTGGSPVRGSLKKVRPDSGSTTSMTSARVSRSTVPAVASTEMSCFVSGSRPFTVVFPTRRVRSDSTLTLRTSPRPGSVW